MMPALVDQTQKSEAPVGFVNMYIIPMDADWARWGPFFFLKSTTISSDFELKLETKH